MSRLVAIIVGVVVIVVAALIAAPMLIPSSVYKERVVAIVKSQTGRDLKIGGDVGLSFFPRLAVKVEDVSLSNAPWAKEPEMVSMREMRAALKILPLFKGEVEIDRFSLVDPVIHLEVKADGTPNWRFETAAAAPAQTAPSSTSGGGASGASSIKQIRLGDVSIVNGSATYRNAKTGASLAFEAIDLDLSLPSLDDPFEAEGSLVWNSEPLKLTLTAERPRALTTGGETPVAFSLSSSRIDASYKGTMRPLEGLRFAGDVKLDVASVRALSAWLGHPLPAGGGFGPLAIEGHASGDSGNYAFSNAKVGFDGMNATGDLKLATTGARPLIKGKLAVDRIDANTYLASGGAASTPAAVGNGASGGGGGWSDDPIDLSGLRAADADITLSAGELLVKKIRIGQSALTLRVNNGVMTANLTKLALYDGTGAGMLSLDGSERVARAKASFAISGVSAEPLLTDAADFTRLQGKTALNFAVETAGTSQRQMVGALGGKGEVKFTNGAIKGVNIAQLARSVLNGPTSGWQSGGSQDTDFSELGGTFTIDHGILTNNDLKMLSPLIRVTGAGTVTLPDRTLNYRIEPKLVATLEGQGGAESAKGLDVPIIIEGPWSSPSFRPDLASMLKNPQQTIDQLKSLKGQGGKDLLKGLLGGSQSQAPASGTNGSNAGSTSGTTSGAPSGSSGGTTTAPTQEKPKPSDALKKLFGG